MLKSLSLLAVAVVALALIGGTASAQVCAQAQAVPQYVPAVQQSTYAAPAVAVPLFVVPSAPTVQLNVQQQYAAPVVQAAPVYAAPVVVQQAAPVVVQKQVIQRTVVQPVIQKQVIQKQAAPLRQRSFSLQRTVIR